ncbi:hypothetical protein KSP40_PGU003607 [Platanthera guangdongensis]|uniref:Uncharacterized protein n=1 Tax=Platanthera guangdongensis TaxID=2320717 RepID=A0ABR2MZ39_9ASPA
MEKKTNVHPECINASNPYHECVDYCLRKIVEAKAFEAEQIDEDQNDVKAQGARTVHPVCINASNPYHECSEFCFRRIAELQDKTMRCEQGGLGFNPQPLKPAIGISGCDHSDPWRGIGVNDLQTCCSRCYIKSTVGAQQVCKPMSPTHLHRSDWP